MTTIRIFWTLLQLLIGCNLIMPFVVYLIYLGRKRKKHLLPEALPQADYAIIVTAYEQTELLPEVVNSILNMNYQHFLIYIVADKCDISQLHFTHPKVILLRPEQTLASNVRSHFYAIRNFKRPHNRLTIIDSDNLVDPEYLNELNKVFALGFEAVQGVRAAKNLNTPLACLDAARDIYYHFYDGKLLFHAGSSATLAGSGMAFTTRLYKECLEHLDIVGAGFDKVLQYQIVSRGYRIAFAEKAVVYDEKTTHAEQLVKQRARWINTWFTYFSYGFALVVQGIRKANWNHFLFGVILLRPPLFIFLILSVVCALLNLFIAPVASFIWLAGFLLFVTSFIFALVQQGTDPRIYQSLKAVPRFIFYQLKSLSKVRVANKFSVATTHYYSETATSNRNEHVTIKAVP